MRKFSGRAPLGAAIFVAAFAMMGVKPMPALSLRPHFHVPTVTVIRPTPAGSVNPLQSTSPTGWWLDGLMFDSLARIRGNTVTPELAVKWRSWDHGKVWRIQLNPRAKWWNGRPVSVHDVIWSYHLKSTAFAENNRALTQLDPQFKVDGRLEFTVTLARSTPQFLRQFGTSNPAGWILPAFLFRNIKPHTLLSTPYLNNPVDMVGSGPYRLLKLNAHGAELEANMHYFLGIPKDRLIKVVFGGDTSTKAGG